MASPNPRSASICVDFGTSHTVVSIRHADGRVRQQLFDGSPQLPSAVYREASGRLITGTDAIHHGRRDPGSFEPNPKRRIDDGSVLLGDHDVPVGDVIGAVLARVRAETASTGPIGSVVVTVPAVWGPTRRHAIADAASAVGLGPVTTVAEPVAAAAHFTAARRHELPVGAGVVVYDLGGGTFDATVLRRTETGFEVLAVDGAGDLGGLDVDHALTEHLARTVEPGDPRWDRLRQPSTVADRRLRLGLLDEIRGAKERLSRLSSTDVTLPLFDRDVHLTRDELESVAKPLLERTIRITTSVIREAGLGPAGVAGIFLAGAGSRMPLIATLLHTATGIAPATVEQPELAVSEGGLDTPAAPTPPPVPGAPAPGPATVVPSSMGTGSGPVTPAGPLTPPPPVPDSPSPGPRRRRWGPASFVPIAIVVVVIALIATGMSFLLKTNGANSDTDDSAADTITACVGQEMPPWATVNDDGEATGLDVDLVNWVARDQDVDITWADRDSGDCDLITGMNDEAQNVSSAYYKDFPVLVALNNGSHTFDSLGAEPVGIDLGHYGDDFDGEGLPLSLQETYGFSVSHYDSPDDLAQALTDGEVTAAFMYLSQWPQLRRIDEQSGFAIADTDPSNPSFETFDSRISASTAELRDRVDASLANLFAGGSYPRIYEKWVGLDFDRSELPL